MPWLTAAAAVARRTDSFKPIGIVLLASFTTNFLQVETFIYSVTSGWADHEAMFTTTLTQEVLERMSHLDFVLEAASIHLTLLIVNWWTPIPGQLSVGWKWRNRRWSVAACWAIRQVEILAFWGVVLFRPDSLGGDAAMCPLDGAAAASAAAASAYPPGVLDPGSPAAPAPPPLLSLPLRRFISCGGCCRGPIVFREAAVFALIFSAGSVLSHVKLAKRQYRYFDSFADDAVGPGRGGCGIRDPHTGALRSFRPLRGEELRRYRRDCEYPRPDLGDGESVPAFCWWMLQRRCCGGPGRVGALSPVGTGEQHHHRGDDSES